MHPRVLLYPKLPPSAAGDLFDSEISVMPAGFTSHIPSHFKVTQKVMFESCLKMLNPRDDAEMAQNYRWIFQPSLMSVSTSSPFSPLFVAFKGLWLQTTEKRMLCRDMTVGVPGRSVRGGSGSANRLELLAGQVQVIDSWLGEAAMRCSSL